MSVSGALSAHTTMRRALQGRTVSAGAGVLRGGVDWFNMRQSWDATSEVASFVDAAVRQEAVSAQAFQRQAYAAVGVDAREPGLRIEGSLRTGTTTELSYRRLGSDMRRHLVDGAPEGVALDYVLTRLDEMVADDLALAMREQSRRFFMANERTTLGFRRVIRPELSETGTCGLCFVAADRRYSRDDLLPIHARCKCDVLPITADYDPAELNNIDLAAAYEAAGSNRAADLVNVKVEEVGHGELGPRLVPSARPGMAEQKSHLRTRIPRREQSSIERLSDSEQQINEIEAKIAAGIATDYERSRIQHFQAQADDARKFLRDLSQSRENLASRRRAA